MEKRPFGRTGMQVSVVGFGSAEIGMDSVTISDADVELLLNTALEQGINVIDTASSYKRSEGQIGRAISHRRQEYYLFSKCGEVRYIGYSGDSTDALYAVETDKFDVLETSLNIADQEAISLTLDEAAKRQMGGSSQRPLILTFFLAIPSL